MEIRILMQQEILPALHLTWEVFAEDVAPSYTPEGVAQFQEFIRYENIIRMWHSGEVVFFGALEEGELCGVLAVKVTGHICLFFVKKDWQGKGVGKMLFQTVYNFCAQELRVGKLTVNAAPGSVEKYRRMGMTQAGDEQQVNGIRFVPMESFVSMGMVQSVRGKAKTSTIVAAVIGGIVLVLVVILGGIAFIKSIYRTGGWPWDSGGWPWDGYHRGYDDYDDYDDDYGYGHDYGHDHGYYDGPEDEGDPEDSRLSGLNAVEEYIAGDLPYEIKEETYSYYDDEKTSTMVSFLVSYPQLSGLEGTSAEAVNKAIKACAMATVDEIYTNPGEEVKERVLKAETPALISNVSYKVCYATEDFISIAFEDVHAKGDYYLYKGELRTINIGLKDGKIYEIKDIVELGDEFLDEWLDEMRDEAENDAFLSEISQDERKAALEGDGKDGIYSGVFFVHADGIEVGYSLNYPEDDPHDLGYVWVTAPFDFDEIEEYISDRDFWSRLDR